MKTGKNFLNNQDFKVTQAIIKSRQEKKTKKLIIGDSVGDQLYGSYNDTTIVGMTATVALTTVGQYCLLANYFKNNEETLPEKVVLLYNPLSLNNTLSGGLFYSTFAKNMFNSEFKSYLNNETIQLINSWPYAWLLNQKWFRLCPFSPNPESDMPQGEWISPVQYNYIMKMNQICTDNGIEFVALAPPLKESLREGLLETVLSDKHSSEPIFQNYINSISYLPDSLFKDMFHFKHHYIPNDYFGFNE